MSEALEAARRLRLHVKSELLVAKMVGDDEEARITRSLVQDASRVIQALGG